MATLLGVLLSTAARAEERCGDQIASVQGYLLLTRRAKNSFIFYHRQARAAVGAIPEACRDGSWYVAVANVLAQPENHGQPLIIGGTRFERPRDALEAGLRVAPSSPELLALVAHLSQRSGGEAPPLPADACHRLKDVTTPVRKYVCGVAAFNDGRYQEATTQLESIPLAARGKFPDIAKLLDLAAKKTKGAPLDSRRRKKDSQRIALDLKCDPFCP